jgi:signal-transduction protein with cAMP-binding, CBS, and nucleotidyltransferase domain
MVVFSYPIEGGTMRPILELLKKRDTAIWSLKPEDSVFDALQHMANHNVGAMMVMQQDRLVGVLSERDYTRKIALAGKSSRDTKVQDIMTASVLTVSPQTRTRDCMALMSQNKIRHLPIVDAGKVLGMISIRDIMDDIIADHELTISQLQSYIAS